MIQAVEVARTEEAKQKIDFPINPGTTFFSGQDIWLYDPREDPKTCPICLGLADISAGMGGFNGNFIRSMFPFLVILDENTIGGPGEGGRGLSHPNCRCYLLRYIGNPEDSIPAQKAILGKYSKGEKQS